MTVEHSPRRSGWLAAQAAMKSPAPTDGLGAGHGEPMFLTVQEVAEVLRVSPATVRAWIARGEGPPAMRFGKQIRYRPERVMEWVEQQEEGRRVIDRRQSEITGRVVWRVRWYETEPAGGRRERSRTFVTRREALDFERERARARRAGVVSSSRVSVSEVAERYFANLTGTVASRTIQGYRQHWRTHLSPTFGHVPVDRLTVPRIQEFVSALAAQRSAATTRKVHRTLSLILDQAVAERRLAVNPAHGVRLPSLPAQLGDHVLSVDQVEALARKVHHHGTLVRVAAYCGLRWGEVAALQVGDVDLQARRLRVQRAQVEVSGRIEIKAPKSRHGQRRVPIPGRLVDELREQTEGRPASAVLFTSPEGERLRASNWKRWSGWSEAVASMGGRIRFHDLRHTCASLLIQAGATPVEVQRILGHSTPATTLNLYTHLLPDALDGAAAKLDGYLDGRL